MTTQTCCRADGTCAGNGANPYPPYSPEHRCWAIAQQHGRNAASWIDIDSGNAAPILAGIADGDPEILDAYRTPSLAGEYAGDYSEAELLRDCGVVPHDGTLLREEIAEQYLAEVSEAFWAEVEHRCRYHLDSAGAGID